MRMKSVLIPSAALGSLLVFGAMNLPAQEPEPQTTTIRAYHDLWRKLFEDHITWTRMVILGILEDLPSTADYETRLLENYEDMEDALEPYYGEEAEELGDLIQEHLLIAVEILTAADTDDTDEFNDAVARWYENGDAIAAQMAEMNPRFWKLPEAEQMWKEHLDATLAEAQAVLDANGPADVAAYDLVHDLALEMADFFSRGVIRQFRDSFGGNPH
jgi:hypothetical protein